MGFIRSLLVGALAGLAAASPISPRDVEQLDKRGSGSCVTNSDQFAGAVVAGQPGSDTYFCETNWASTYTPITGVTVWWNPYSVNGIQVTYADGSQSPIQGATAQYSGSISLDYAQGQRWGGWTMYYSYTNGNKYIETLAVGRSDGTQLLAGANYQQLYQEGLDKYPIYSNIGSGFLYGFNGTSDGGAISSLSALFLANNVTNIQLTDFTFPDGPTGAQNIGIDDLATAHYYNGQDTGTSTWQFMNSQAIATSHTFTSTITNTYGTTVGFSAMLDLPVIHIGGSAMFMWSTAYAEANAYQDTTTITVSWQESGTLQPMTGVDTTALVGHGTGTYPYSCTATLTLKNGFTFSFPETGSLTIDDVSSALVDVVTDNSPG